MGKDNAKKRGGCFKELCHWVCSCSPAVACICVHVSRNSSARSTEKWEASMIYLLAATGLKSAYCRKVRRQWLHEMATILGPPDLMYEKIAKKLGTDVIMFTK